MVRALITLALVVGTASAATAQVPGIVDPPVPFRLVSQISAPPGPQLRAESPFWHDSTTIRPTHWLKGGVIGGLIVGGSLACLAGLLYDADAGGAPSSRGAAVASAALVGGFAGFIIGALVGGASPKPAAP
jgi:hypothetical protein